MTGNAMCAIPCAATSTKGEDFHGAVTRDALDDDDFAAFTGVLGDHAVRGEVVFWTTPSKIVALVV